LTPKIPEGKTIRAKPRHSRARTGLINGTVMLSGAKHLWLSLGSRNDQRFFASLRMTLTRWLVIFFTGFPLLHRCAHEKYRSSLQQAA